MHDLDDVEEPMDDADLDKVPNIFMQLRKAVDVDGNYPIVFKDGKKAKLNMKDITAFIQKYMNASQREKEFLQAEAGNSLDGFMAAIKKEFKKPDIPKIKGSRYMSSFAGDFDEK